MKSKAYPTDLTDEQWALMEPFFPEPKTEGRTGRPHEYDIRAILNGIFYVLRSGCPWDMMPHDLPPQATCYHYFRLWRDDGTWQKCHDTLREQVRKKLDRDPIPSAAVLDSQSVKTTEKGGRPAKRLLAMMQASMSKDASDIFSQIPRVCFCKSWCMRLIFKIATAQNWFWLDAKSAFLACNASGRTAAMLASSSTG